MKEYKHIIWDWNGTLFDDLHLCVNVMNGLLKKRGMKSISIDYYRDVFTFPVKVYYEKIGFDFNKENFTALGEEWMNIYEKHKLQSSLFPDVLSTLEYFKKIGIKQHLLSAYSLKALKKMVEYFELENYFENIEGLGNIYAESKLELGIKLLNRINMDGGRALLIGDTLHDYETAEAMGIDCVLVGRGHQSELVLSKVGTKIYDSLEDLRKDLF